MRPSEHRKVFGWMNVQQHKLVPPPDHAVHLIARRYWSINLLAGKGRTPAQEEYCTQRQVIWICQHHNIYIQGSISPHSSALEGPVQKDSRNNHIFGAEVMFLIHSLPKQQSLLTIDSQDKTGSI